MDKEASKMGLKRKSKPKEMLFNSDDDEPIGALLKLKGKRNPKKGKVVAADCGYKAEAEELAVEDEELGGMNDTLASFKKKLKGPKRESGSVAEVGKSLGSSVVELSSQALNESARDVGIDPVTKSDMQKIGLESKEGEISGNAAVVPGLKLKAIRESKRSKGNKSTEMVGRMTNGDESSEHAISRNAVSVQESADASDLGNGSSDDSLSMFFQKAQLDVMRKSRSSSKLKQGEGTKVSDGSKLNTVADSEPSDGLCQSAPKLVNKIALLEESSHVVAGQGSLKSNLISRNTGDQVTEVLNSTQLDSVCIDSMLVVSSTAQEWSSSDSIGYSSKGIPQNSAPVSVSQRSPSNLRACSGKIPRVQDVEVKSRASKGQRDSAREAAYPKNMERGCEFSHGAYKNHKCLLFPQGLVLDPKCEKQGNGENLDSQLNENITIVSCICKKTCSAVEEHSDYKLSIEKYEDAPSSSPCSICGKRNLEVSASQHEHIENVGRDVTLTHGLHAGLRSNDLEQTACHTSPTTHNRLLKEHTSGDCDTPHEHKSQKAGYEPEKVLETFHELLEVSRSSNSVERYEDKEVNGTSYSSMVLAEGSRPDDRGRIDDPETKDSLFVQRAARNARKRRHGDMAYEGDVDWDALMQSQESFISNRSVDKTREKFNSSSMVVDAENGKLAAVSAGLRARAVGPIEKIKFKEVLKRKGGHQEYLECRNYILSIWNKDVSRILQLEDFGLLNVPMMGESSRVSLLRDVYFFLDQRGYINFGVTSEKEKGEKYIKHDVKLLKEEKFGENSGRPVGDTEDGVSFITGKEKRLGTCSEGQNVDTFADEKQAGTLRKEDDVHLHAIKLPGPSISEERPPVRSQEITCPVKKVVGSKYLKSLSSCKDNDVGADLSRTSGLAPHCEDMPVLPLKCPKSGSAALLGSIDCVDSNTPCDSEPRKSVIIIGAGPAGLTAARHLQRQGLCVTVLEARKRIGGRVFTDRSSLSVPVDLGASIITGVEADVDTERRPDPSSLICAQLGLELTVLNSACPIYDTVTGQKAPADVDKAVEAEYNRLLDDMVLVIAEKGECAMKMSLEEGMEYRLKTHRMSPSEEEPGKSVDSSVALKTFIMDDKASDVCGSETEGLTTIERRLMDWHLAHLEYACAGLLKEVSLPNWNQDDIYGGFGGAHCMIKGGYSSVLESLGEGISIHLEHVVTDIQYFPKNCGTNNDLQNRVKVFTVDGMEFSGDAVLVTVPLGCLKAETIKFSPPLPQWKYLSIRRLGFGILNKVVLEFPEVFWDDTLDYFGATAEDTDQRGRCFMFWNLRKTVGAPVLIALVVGKAAVEGQNISAADQVSHALLVLRKLFGEDKVSDPVASVVTDWGRDPYSYGAYSYVAVGSSGEDYDILGRPVEDCVFFAGEATCKEHPDTVGGAMLSGLREAVRIIDILSTGTDFTAEVEAMEAARRHSDIERSEVKDIIRRLNAVEFSSAMYKNSLDGSQISTWDSMLKDIFFTARTTAGRLHLARELLNLPIGFLRTFASTKEGLSTLNSWILDSMGKNGTQLLRHCVRLLVLVSNDLLAVRLSGIGKTIKEKVCVHTSRDIRAIATQLVNLWVELFQKERLSRGGMRLMRQPSAPDSKSKSGKPPLRTHHVISESKGSSKVFASAGHQLLSSVTNMEVIDKAVKLEPRIDPNSDGQTADSHASTGCRNVMEENHETSISEEEKAAIIAAEAARAAAIAATKAYAASGVKHNALPQLPKILSFHKFAMRGQHANIDESDSRKNWSGNATGKLDCLSEIDSRNCRVRDWSVDFSTAGVNLENSKLSVDNRSHRSHSNEVTNQLHFREHSEESVAVDSSILTKAWVDSAGSMGIKDYSDIARWQCQAAAASSGYSQGTMHVTDEENSNESSKLHKQKHEALVNESSASQVSINKESKANQPKGLDCLKQAVVDYVASLLMPLYKDRKLDREDYKSIMKKTATKVMEKTTDDEKAMAVYEFLDFKRKNKIRAFVDVLIDRHIAKKPDTKPGLS